MAAEKRKAESTTATPAKKIKAPYKAEYKAAKLAKREGTEPKQDGSTDPKQFKLETSSAEAHAKQRAQAKERKAAKPNADIIARSKKIWEQLRRKSHVDREVRKELVTELFEIITGRVRDFVFKHDSVRVIQCALKYANLEQRRVIVKELQGDIRALAESRYAKFLVAKMITSGDDEIRDMIIPEFYGHVKRLINHPEASWIVDDIYRQIATPEQKAIMLREWYGAEYAIFNRQAEIPAETADLVTILKEQPEKRKPILHFTHDLINGLVQKKMTGFTMLHDAMLQYFLVLTPGSEEQRAFLEEMLDDVDAETEGGGGDLYKNLAFTKSGSRLVCLALAYGTPKDRKVIVRVFKDTLETMAFDKNAKMVLLACLELPDDTQMTTKGVYRDLLGDKLEDKEQRMDKILSLILDSNAKVPLLFPLLGSGKWLLPNEADQKLVDEMFEIRKTSSKKEPQVRAQQLLEYLSTPLLEVIINRAAPLTQQAGGWHFITEALLGLKGELRDEAKSAVAALVEGDPSAEDHPAQDASTGRALKTLISGGNFNAKEKKVKLVEPRLGFAEAFWPVIEDHAVAWACGPSSFAVVALLETVDAPAKISADVKSMLKKGPKKIKAAAEAELEDKDAKGKDKKGKSGNPGARILLQKLA